MLYIILSSFVIFPVLMGIGYFIERYIGILWEGISAKMLLGMLFLLIFWHFLAFFIPINFYVELVSILVGWGLFLYFKQYRELKLFIAEEGILLGSLSAVTFLVGSGYPFILDHFGYYVPSIKWISEVGLVKGIANLDWVLGQMSPWHIFQAGFSHFSDEYLRINSLLLVLFFVYIIDRKSWGMLCFSPILFFFIQSPSPDLPSIVFSLIILNEVLKKNQAFSFLFGFSMIVFSIKPTMLWLPILTFFYSTLFYRTHIKFIGIGFSVGILYLTKNIWVFGYPFFPIQALDLGLAWKPYETFFVESGKIALLKTFDLQYTLKEIHTFSPLDYFKNWMMLKGIKGSINIAFILSLISFGVYTLWRRDKTIYVIFISILIKSIVVIGFSAQYRFFIEVFFVIFVVVLEQYFSKKYSLVIFSVLGVVIASVLFFPNILKTQIPSFNLGYVMQDFEWKQVNKPSHYIFNQYKTHKVGNLVFNVPKDYIFNFDVDLPVLTLSSLERFEKYGVFPQLRGRTWKEGFVWKKLKEADMRELKNVVKEIKKERDSSY